jgi:hypothetical protein
MQPAEKFGEADVDDGLVVVAEAARGLARGGAIQQMDSATAHEVPILTEISRQRPVGFSPFQSKKYFALSSIQPL